MKRATKRVFEDDTRSLRIAREGLRALYRLYLGGMKYHYAYGAHLGAYGHLQPLNLILWVIMNDELRKSIPILDLGRACAASGTYKFTGKWSRTVEEKGVYFIPAEEDWRPPFQNPLNPRLKMVSKTRLSPLVLVPLTVKVSYLVQEADEVRGW